MKKVGIYLAGLDESSKIYKLVTAEEMLGNFKVDSSKLISSIVTTIHVRVMLSLSLLKRVQYYFFFHKELTEAELEKLVQKGIVEPISHSMYLLYLY